MGILKKSPMNSISFISLLFMSNVFFSLFFLLHGCSPKVIKHEEKGKIIADGGQQRESFDEFVKERKAEPEKRQEWIIEKEKGIHEEYIRVQENNLKEENNLQEEVEYRDGGEREEILPEPSIEKVKENVAETLVEKTPEHPPIAFDPTHYIRDSVLFPSVVQAGAMYSTSAILWTFVKGGVPVTLKVWRSAAQSGMVVMDYDKQIKPTSAGYAKITVTGLKSDTWYRYAFFKGNKRSVIGRFHTAFAPNALKKLKIGAPCCTNHKYFKTFKSLKLMAKEKLDFLVHLGDTSYNDSAKDLKAYRKKWKELLGDEGYRALLPTTGSYFTWDDHEVYNNYDPEHMDKKRFQAAKQAFVESIPVELSKDGHIWHKYSWGKTADIFVLDCRSERKPSTRKTSHAIYISKAQMEWLKKGLSQSKAHFKVIINSVPITNMPKIWLSASDRWEGYASQRKELLNHIVDNHIKNVWFLTGDFHVGFVSKVEPKGKWSILREIAVGPSGSGYNPLGKYDWAMPKSQFEHHSSEREVVTTFEFDPFANTVRVRCVNSKNNKVLFDKKLSQ